MNQHRYPSQRGGRTLPASSMRSALRQLRAGGGRGRFWARVRRRLGLGGAGDPQDRFNPLPASGGSRADRREIAAARTLATASIRSRSRFGRSALVAALGLPADALTGRALAASLAIIDTARSDTARSVSVRERALLILLARVLLFQRLDVDDFAGAIALYARAGSPGALPRLDQRYLAEALLMSGRTLDARALTTSWSPRSPDEQRLHADADNPFRTGAAPSRQLIEGWLDELFADFDAARIERPGLSDAGGTPFGRLHATPTATVDGEVLITVVVAAYRPGAALTESVRSVLASSWQRLEVLVIDDASGPEFDAAYQRIADLDPRIRVHRAAVNGGPYALRNLALSMARGALMTFHDDDDWMHPRRLELQARHLLDHPALPANTSAGIRLTEDLSLSPSRGPQAKLCEPSLMFRIAEVRERIGGFDPVRKSGDVEFRERIAAAFGVSVPRIGELPLTLQRARSGSLSDADIGREWLSDDRRLYHRSFRAWHRQIREGRVDGRLDPTHLGGRRCWAPRSIVGAADTEPARAFDLVLLSNAVADGAPEAAAAVRLLEPLAARGLRIALAHASRLWLLPERSEALALPLIDAVNAGTIDLITLDAAARASTVIARVPATPAWIDPAEQTGLGAGALVLLPPERGAAAPDAVRKRLQRLFAAAEPPVTAEHLLDAIRGAADAPDHATT